MDSSRVIVANFQDWETGVSKFKFLLHYYVRFQINTLEKRRNSLIS